MKKVINFNEIFRKMSISVVMLSYNNYQKILRCMTTMFPFITDNRIKEFIILDNGSHEIELKNFLKTISQQIDKVRVIFSDTNLGIAKGRKVLYDTCESEYIVSVDSDIVIVNPGLFIEILYKALDIENVMLVGGGGGNHVYFPSLERENIDNKESPENPNELLFVDEVAGWFHGFKSSILTKNGGPIEMDEQFTPFWSEDSDFCMQIKVNKGRCCIMGKGVVGHQWSSCDKKETQKSLDLMWYKFQDKWYNIFGKEFNFPIEEKFYQDNHEESKNLLRSKEYYYKVGMIEGHFYSKEPIKLLFSDLKFINNTTVKLNDEVMELKDFNSKIFTYDNIVKNNFKIFTRRLPKNMDNLIILTVFNIERAIEILKKLISLQSINVIISTIPEIPTISIESFLRKYNCNYSIVTFPNFNLDLIHYIITFKEMVKHYNVNNVLNLSTERDNSSYITNELKKFTPGSYLKHQVSKIDQYNLSFLDQVISLNNNMMWNTHGVYYEKVSFLNKLFSSFPLMECLMKSLRIPRNYINFISPRCSPKHSLERIIGYLKPKISTDNKTLYTIVCNIDTGNDLDKISNNLRHFNNGDTVVFNLGSYNKVDLRHLNCNYYYKVERNTPPKILWLNSVSTFQENNYSNYVFMDDSFEIVGDLKEFQERAIFKNICLCMKEDKFETELFSIVSDNMGDFFENLNKEDSDIQTILKKLNTKAMWYIKTTEEEDEIITEYFKKGLDDGEDFPLV